jgi:hypothetical protein
MVYSALNGGVEAKEQKSFRKEWRDHGSYLLAELLLRCASPDWSDYGDTFWINPWIAEHLRPYEPNELCYVMDQWLANKPLPQNVSDDPLVEHQKVPDLERLSAALNR